MNKFTERAKIKAMSTLAELERERDLLLAKLKGVKQRILDIQLSQVEATYGVRPGVVVRSTRDQTMEVMVVSVRLWGGRKPWVSGYMRKKDGNFGKAYRQLYSDWEVV